MSPTLAGSGRRSRRAGERGRGRPEGHERPATGLVRGRGRREEADGEHARGRTREDNTDQGVERVVDERADDEREHPEEGRRQSDSEDDGEEREAARERRHPAVMEIRGLEDASCDRSDVPENEVKRRAGTTLGNTEARRPRASSSRPSASDISK